MSSRLALVLLLCLTTPLLAQGKAKKQARRPAPAASEKEDDSRVVLAFDPGSHTRPIAALGFNKDQTRLITAGWDYTIQIWSTTTGERLDILRLPAYGRDNGFDSNRWNHAAISGDGAFVAVGGGPKLLFDDKGVPTRLLIVDVANRRIRKLILPGAPETEVTCLSFSDSGNRLAIGLGGNERSVYVLEDIVQLMRSPSDAKLPSEPMQVVKGMSQPPYYVALSQTGNKLAIEDRNTSIASWDISGKAPEKWKQLGESSQKTTNDALEWSPDESHFVRSWRKGQEYALELRAADCQMQKSWQFRELAPGFANAARVATFRYLSANQLFISAHATVKGQGRACVGVTLDPVTGKTVRHFTEDSSGTFQPFGAASASGPLAATTSQRGLDAVIYRLTDGKTVARCGSRMPVPTVVAWSKDPAAPAIAWSDDAELTPERSTTENLNYAFDLSRIEPMADFKANAFDLHRFGQEQWKLSWSDYQQNFVGVRLNQGSEETFKLMHASAMSLIPNGEQPPLFAYSVHDTESGMGSLAFCVNSSGKRVADLLPVATHVRDMVSSPDGRYLLVSTGTHRLSIYRTDGSRFPFLNLVRANGEWACWTPEGYYAASPGGEKMIGWSESQGSSKLPLFHPAEKFAAQFRRPDIIQLALAKGSVRAALEALKLEVRNVEEILPPQCLLEKVKQDGSRVQIRAVAKSTVKDKPVVSMRLLLDGRPIVGGAASQTVANLQQAEATWEIEVPAGNHELKLLARNADSSAVSDALTVTGPKSVSQQPTLHRICVGINEYENSALNLGAAAKDAGDVFAAFEQYCVGPQNRFGTASGTILTNQQATRTAVLKAIGEARKAARPGDLVVLFFAGHGIKQQEEFYLLTHEADLSASLKGKSLSGEDLRQALSDMECPVLLIMDACHSASGVKAFRPATDDLTRSLTDDTTGVTIFAAAMAHEVASATKENGYFTAAFLKALQLGQGVPFDPYEHVLYTHHIYSVVFSDVRKATNGKQNPFLNMPWTVPPLVLREVPHSVPADR